MNVTLGDILLNKVICLGIQEDCTNDQKTRNAFHAKPEKHDNREGLINIISLYYRYCLLCKI